MTVARLRSSMCTSGAEDRTGRVQISLWKTPNPNVISQGGGGPSASKEFVGRLTQHASTATRVPGQCAQRFLSTPVASRGILPKEQPQEGSDSIVDPECRMGSEKELLEAFERIIHEDSPNPQRVGCPGDEALLKLAEGAGDVQQTHLLAHIRQCAPCFDKLKELRSRSRNRSPQDI